MARRYVSPRDPVTVTLDDAPLVAERGEPLAVSLVAAGRLALARSAKFHRPRGVACLRGGCDGCLARVSGVPNVMTCRVAACEGASVTTQNSLGSREVDLLQVTDWFFPRGLNHHELLAGVPLAHQAMQAFAQRVAGLGRLPTDATPVRPAVRRELPVLVIGAGGAGMATACAIADAGLHVEVIDDSLVLGGTAAALMCAPEGRAAWQPLFDRFETHTSTGRIRVRLETPAIGLFGDDVVVLGHEGAEVVHAEHLVFATGGHDGTLIFPGNDLPGIMSARAAGWFLQHGVVVGDNVLVAIVQGGTGAGAAFAQAAAAISGVHVTVAEGVPTRARGGTSVRDGRVQTARGDVELSIDAFIIDAPVSPSYELPVQAGATVSHTDAGFVVNAPSRCIRGGIYAVGEVVGTRLTPEALEADAAAVAQAILSRP